MIAITVLGLLNTTAEFGLLTKIFTVLVTYDCETFTLRLRGLKKKQFIVSVSFYGPI